MMRRVIKLAYLSVRTSQDKFYAPRLHTVMPGLAMTSYFIKVSGLGVFQTNDGTSKSFRDHPILLWEQSNKFLLHFHGQLGHDLPD